MDFGRSPGDALLARRGRFKMFLPSALLMTASVSWTAVRLDMLLFSERMRFFAPFAGAIGTVPAQKTRVVLQLPYNLQQNRALAVPRAHVARLQLAAQGLQGAGLQKWANEVYCIL